MVQAIDSSADKLNGIATAVGLERAGMWPAGQQMPEGAMQHRNASLVEFMAADLRHRGIQTAGMSREDVALEHLQLEKGVTLLRASAGSFERPGDHPNLLSNLMGKILDQAMEVADATYSMWTDRLPDTPDFKPRTIIGMGSFDELNLVEDDDPAESLNASEEVVGWIKADRYNGKTGLTPIMIANDDLGGYAERLKSLVNAHENTLNRMCVELLATNPVLLDGYSLFDATNHGNDIVAGGEPSATQGQAMWQQWFQQTNIGGTQTIRTPPTKILYPAILDYGVKQTFSPFAGMVETKQATTDANLNTLRGQFEMIREPELDNYSQLAWYWLANPKMRRAFVHMFMTGYGRGGRRTTWFDPDRETRYVKLEGRFGAANAGHRGVLRNRGQDES